MLGPCRLSGILNDADVLGENSRPRYVPVPRRVDDLDSSRASRRSFVVIQHATKPRAATNPALLPSDAVDQPIPKTLMIAFAMIVLDELVNCLPEMALADGNDPIETLFLNRPDEPLGEALALGARRGVCTT